MSFLTPLYIAGALMIALPILFHLIRRTPRDRIPFSTLMFLRESPPRVTRRSKLEHLLLLLLRAAALALLAAAFARPFLRQPLLAETDTGAGRIVAIVVDNSASMRRENLRQQAIVHVNRTLDELRPTDHACLMAFDEHVRTLVTFDEWMNTARPARTALVKDSVDSLPPSWHATRLGTALATAADTVDAYAAQLATAGIIPEQHIVLVSDLQNGSDLAGLRQFEWPKPISVRLATVAPAKRSNASIQLIEDRDSETGLTPKDRLRVRVANVPDSDRNQFRVRWAGADTEPVEVHVAPGKSRVIQLATPPANGNAEQLMVDGDEQDFDNALFLVPRRAETVPVLFLGDGDEDDPKGLRYYFERAFPETPWRSVRVTVRDPAEPLVPADLSNVRFAVLGHAASDETDRQLRQFVLSGGSLLCVLADRDVAASAGRILGVEQWSTDEAAVREYAMLGEIDYQHRLFAPFSDPRFGDFTKIHFWRHRRIELGPLGDTRVLARFDDGDPALVELPRGDGRVFLLTAGWHPIDSQLALSSKFVPLLGGMLDYALGTPELAVSLRVGEPAPIPERGSATWHVRSPDGTEQELPAGAREFSGTDQPGLYSVLGPGTPLRFSVNLDPNESDTAPLATELLEQLGVRLAAAPSASSAAVNDARQRQLHAFELESRQKLWRWLIVAALAVLLIETWLAGLLTTRTQAQTT